MNLAFAIGLIVAFVLILFGIARGVLTARRLDRQQRRNDP